LTATVQNSNLGKAREPGWSAASRRRRPIIFGVALSLLMHVAGLWFLIEQSTSVIKPVPPGGEGRVTVFLAPPANPPARAQAPASASSEPEKTPAPRVAKRKPVRKPPVATITPREIAPKSAPRVTEPDVASTNPAPADDMFTQLQAARKRRAEAQAREQASQAVAGSPQQEEAPDPNSVALANIATSLRANGVNRDDSGGLFQVRRVGFRDATFVFRGWNVNSRRTSNRLITVEQGAEPSIQLAVVKKMIEIIREQKSDTFIWESHRLGKQLTLSARPEDSIELQQFLMREFFSD
jgi:hypothetical protein